MVYAMPDIYLYLLKCPQGRYDYIFGLDVPDFSFTQSAPRSAERSANFEELRPHIKFSSKGLENALYLAGEYPQRLNLGIGDYHEQKLIEAIRNGILG